MRSDPHHGPRSLPPSPGQHATLPQTLLATISRFHLFECAGLSASNSAPLSAFHYISRAGSLTTTCLRCSCRQGYRVESTIGSIHVRLVRWKRNRSHHCSCQRQARTQAHALAGVAQWMEHQPANQKDAGSIPGQGTCLCCSPGPQLRVCERQPINVSQSSPSPLSKNT